MKQFKVSQHDILAFPHRPLYETNIILAVLKDKGAPILGSFYLTIDPNYNCSSYREPETNDLVFHFEKQKNIQYSNME